MRDYIRVSNPGHKIKMLKKWKTCMRDYIRVSNPGHKIKMLKKGKLV